MRCCNRAVCKLHILQPPNLQAPGSQIALRVHLYLTQLREQRVIVVCKVLGMAKWGAGFGSKGDAAWGPEWDLEAV
jgi:hypothetical protein